MIDSAQNVKRLGRPKSDPKKRFLEKVKAMDSGCQEWQSVIHWSGYGKFHLDGEQMFAHRAAYLLFVGEIPNGMQVLHKCDNRKCVNLAHLYLGDAKQNAKDKVERCRWWGRMKFDASTIDKCKRMYSEGMTQQAIAKLIGMDQTSVSRFVRGDHLQRM